ncbi:fused response regulator/phosphatase [Ketobacter sp.]|uniref:ATP-binding SpoIIE family protein phosphatase n=1 Tax=Ketobacter sp. TaxID=2083498 RepID=UPI000F217821|nr:fused response regulator/phosphatase [Ketobacter sp.]RLT92491.1 MAG: response regulator [Ketobacter sp.]
MKILVVDDTEANRKLLAWMLEDDGHEVVEATNGEEAVELFKSATPDLVLMDVMMPIMDGFEATQAIKEHLRGTHVPIIFLTALSDDASLTKCLSIGGDDFLSKPINEQVLQAKIKAHSRIKDLNEQLNRQNKELTRLHQFTLREHEIAKNVFENALAASILDSKNTRHYISPAATFNGDLLLVTISPSGGLYALMADFTGHGLPAAIGALPVSQAFLDAAQQGASVSSIAREVNRTLEKFLPDDMFAAAAIAELNAEGNRLTLWMGGMPDALHTDASGALKQKIPSTHMPLGILEDDEFEREANIIEVADGDRLYLYTDGIPESLNSEGEMYGENRMLDHFDGASSDPLTSLIESVNRFTGHKDQNDDITLLELICKPVEAAVSGDASVLNLELALPWTLHMTLTAEEMKKPTSPVAQLVDMISSAPGIESHKDYLHTILAELYSNALEHGILGLRSDLKKTEDGYLEYYQQREEKLQQLSCGTLDITVSFRVEGRKGYLSLQLDDSGCGFDVAHRNHSTDEDSFGRGIDLIETLCDRVSYSEGGTRVEAEYTIHT